MAGYGNYYTPPAQYGLSASPYSYQPPQPQVQGVGAGYPQQNMPPVQEQPLSLLGWPVDCEESARRANIAMDGRVFYFPDYSHGMIYTKQINTADYSAVFRRYSIDQETQKKTDYVTREEFDQLAEKVNGIYAAPAKRAAREEAK